MSELSFLNDVAATESIDINEQEEGSDGFKLPPLTSAVDISEPKIVPNENFGSYCRRVEAIRKLEGFRDEILLKLRNGFQFALDNGFVDHAGGRSGGTFQFIDLSDVRAALDQLEQIQSRMRGFIAAANADHDAVFVQQNNFDAEACKDLGPLMQKIGVDGLYRSGGIGTSVNRAGIYGIDMNGAAAPWLEMQP